MGVGVQVQEPQRGDGADQASLIAQLPPYTELLWPTLQALIALGGSASNNELDSAVVEREGWSPAVQGIVHGDGPGTEVEYRLAWARTYLKGMGLLANSRRAVWSVTKRGREVTESDIRPLLATFTADKRRQRLNRKANSPGAQALPLGETHSTPEPDSAYGESGDVVEWKAALLDAILRMSSTAFERLTQRLLREAGFSTATITGRSSDGGMDGIGMCQISLLSFPVAFQCKRVNGSVGVGAVRDLRGAMAGRGEKGLLITTGTFTSEARAESRRDGAPPVDLIDGDRLCELLKEHALGVRTTTRVVEDVAVQVDFFAGLESD
ncbi:restriction endonuclease [Rhodococcus sp. SGAir0479]|uniref:restriction endonuclease n=1 Tax=Rhodococcus sp. SGAir0479 TaxID=2567884 RepID=UPI0010CD657C|nr:restriction endonuclease [Rhodococcus sp. SGAir0479]QCQ90272.1 restriction endonuclease [Rhodococcus sp. SGAir0479]